MKISEDDKRIIERLIYEYADMIFRIAYQNLGNRADAEDIFQEVCIALITKTAPIHDEKHIKNWLIRVTINKCTNFHKSFWNRNRENLTETIEYIPPAGKELLDSIRRLPPKYRNIIYLYYYEGYSIAEISELLNMNKNTVSSALSRARKQLGEILTEEGLSYG